MEITNANGHFYVDDIELYTLAQSNGIAIDDMPYSMVASLAIPYDLYLLQQEKARLEAIPRVTDEYLLDWARSNCPEVPLQEANDRQLIDITNRINSWQQ